MYHNLLFYSLFFCKLQYGVSTYQSGCVNINLEKAPTPSFHTGNCYRSPAGLAEVAACCVLRVLTSF